MLKNLLNPNLFLALILVAGFWVRLYKIDNPIADWHSWRQADTAAVTRNFFKYGLDVLHPRYDDFSDVRGNESFNPQGYRFVEFPIFNLIHYSLTALFPFKPLEYWGRMISILAALTSALFIYLIASKRANTSTGLLASAIYLLLPYNIYFTRVILPDPLMVTFFLAALYAHEAKKKILSVLLGASAILIKPMAVFFLLPIIFTNFWFGLIMLLPFGLWRLWSFRFPQGVPASLWLLNGNKIRFKGAFFYWIFGKRLGTLILGRWGIFPFTLGLSAMEGFWPWALGAGLYLFTFATGNVQHGYYQLPIIPIVAILISLGAHNFASTITKKIIVLVCLLFMIAFSWYEIRGNYQINHWGIIHAGQAADKLLPKDAIVIAPYDGDTAFLYQINRRGFPSIPLPINELIKNYGVQYYVSVNYDDQTNAVIKTYTVLEKTPEYVIVKLVKKS